MINPLTHLLFLVAAWLVFGLTGQRRPALILTIGGGIFLSLYAPIALAWIAWTAIEACLITLWLKDKPRTGNLRQYGPYVLLLNLLFVDLHPEVLLISVDTLAISFSTIRIFMTSKQLLAARKDFEPGDLKWVWAAAYYLPALLVGPVFSGLNLRKQGAENARPDLSAKTFRFLLTGLVTVLLINPAILMVARLLNGSPRTIDLGIEGAPIYFAIIFTGFYGQSLIAEYTSRLFGRTLPANFDRPWRADSIRNFWQRWHRSMANFVMQYIYLPLNMRGVNGRVATVMAFVFMGLWHNLSLGYFLWGLGHGLLLAFWPKNVESKVGAIASRVITWSAVLGLSYLANYSWIA